MVTPFSIDRPRLRALFADDGRSPAARGDLLDLLDLFAALPPPPDPESLFARYAELHDAFLRACADPRGDADSVEEAFLTLYAHVHGHEAPYTAAERARMDETGGYWCHAGGLAPILEAGPYLHGDTTSGDFGAGNGLQSLLMMRLHPHRLTVQIEISSRMVAAGRALQGWLGIPDGRVRWVVGDVLDASPAGMGFVYLYRPVRPEGPGRAFYERFASELERSPVSPVIFSIADCLGAFLSERFEAFYGDGHLTCYRRLTRGCRPPRRRNHRPPRRRT